MLVFFYTQNYSCGRGKRAARNTGTDPEKKAAEGDYIMASIKEILGNVWTEDLEKALNEHIGKNFIPTDKYNGQKSELDGLRAQLAERDAQLKELQKAAKGNEELTAQIAQLQKANKEAMDKYNADIKALNQERLLDAKLMGAKPKNLKSLKALIDTSKLKFSEDSIEGLDEQLTALKTSDAYLFDDGIPSGTGMPANGGLTPPVENTFNFGFAGVRPNSTQK